MIIIANFKELNENMNIILTKMINNKNLCKLLYFDSEDCLSKPDVESPNELLYKRIFPHPFTVDIETEVMSFVTVSFGNIKPSEGKHYKHENIIIRILCHQNLWKVENGGMRPFLICEEIDKLFNDTKGIGIGKSNFLSGNELWANKTYSGFTLIYNVIEFSKSVV